MSVFAARALGWARWNRIAVVATAALASACGHGQREPEPEAAVGQIQQALSCGSAGAGGTAPQDSDPGAYLVDLGQAPQTTGNALRPYGLVYDLVKNQKIPVLWAYNTAKAANTDVDFSVDGRSFRAGAFVIPGAFVAAAKPTIDKWVASGVVVYGPTKAAFTPPTYFKRMTGFPNIVLDPQTGAVAQAYLTAAGMPVFPVQLPTNLSSCQDMFVLPHADPTWATHGNLKTFVTNGGYLWVGCHAVSVLEALDGDGDKLPDMAFLSNTGLINYGLHGNATPPYSYDGSALADPVMQFLGVVDSALSNGSEQVYLPLLGGSWRSTTKVATWDPDQADVVAGKSPGKAVKIAYGRGYGLPSSGIVMYEASHNFAGSSADQIAAQRAFLNLVMWNASEKSVAVAANVPTKLIGSQQVSLTATVTSSSAISSYQWTSSCGGTFGTPTAKDTTFTPPAAAIQNTPCVIRLTASDGCSRTAFDARDTTILGLPDLAVKITPSSLSPTIGAALDYTIDANNVGGLPTQNSTVSFTVPSSSSYTVQSVTTQPAGIVCTAGAGANSNVYTCPVGDLDGCNPVQILVKGTVTATGCLAANVTGTTTSNDVDPSSNAASTQTCVAVSGDKPVITKSMFPAAPSTTNPGATLTYTMSVSNGGTTKLTNLHVIDQFSTNTTYVANSALVTYPSYVSTVADSFPGKNYTGSTGAQPWSGPWTELKDTGRSNSPSQGNVRVRKDGSCASTACANVTSAVDGNGIQRQFSLQGATSASLSFTYKIPTNKAGDAAFVGVSANGGATWRQLWTSTLATKVNASTAVGPLALQNSELVSNVLVRFVTSGTAKALWAPDDIVLTVNGVGQQTTAVGSTPAAGNGWDLTENLNGTLSLAPGDSLSVTFRVTVKTVAGGTAISNNAKLTSTEVASTTSNTVSINTAAVATKSPVAANETIAVTENASGFTLGITAPTDADTAQANLTVTVSQTPQASQGQLYLADGVTPVFAGQTLTVAQLTALKFTPATNFRGSVDPFVYIVTDPQANTGAGSATLTITAVNQAPVAYPDEGFTQQGVAVVLDPPGANDTDVDGNIDDALYDLDPATGGTQSTRVTADGTWSVDTDSASATFGSVTFTPANGFHGAATVSYTSTDDGSPPPVKTSAPSTITVHVNAPPVAVADAQSTFSTGGSWDVTANDSDPDGIIDVTTVDLDPATAGIQSTMSLACGTFTALDTGKVKLAPAAAFNGACAVSYVVGDFDGGVSNAVALTVTVNPCGSAADCSDGNACTGDACAAGVCANPNAANGSACDDGNSSTKTDVCDGSGNCGGTVYTCTPGACELTSVPNGTGCATTPKPDGSACDDGNACTQTDSCQTGVCAGASPVVCSASDQCHDAGSCDPSSGVCSNPAKANGSPCNDGNACTQTDACQTGACTGSNAVSCTASDQCHSAGTCDPSSGACSNPAKGDGAACNDNDACTQTDACQAGACSGSNPIICANPTQPVCMATSGACGCSSDLECAAPTPFCVVATRTCVACLKDADCSNAQFCNTETNACVAKLPNATAIPTIAGHSPALTGDCSVPVGSAVCSAAVCGANDDKCGYPNGQGPCDANNAAAICRSAVCDLADSKCGYADGDGPCTQGDAATVCRSGACSVSGVCQPAANCTVDADCVTTQFCNNELSKCVAKLPNGTAIPTLSGHTPPLTGACNAPVATAVCIGVVCDTADNQCGYANGDGSCDANDAATVCRSAVCDLADTKCGYANGDGPCDANDAAIICRSAVCDLADTKCGYANGDGPCTPGDAATVCRSGSCSVSGVCQPAASCTVDSDCVADEFCNTEQHTCSPKLANGTKIPTVAGHTPVLSGACSAPAATAVCSSRVCDSADDECGYENGSGPCDAGDAASVCRSAVCDLADDKCGYANGDGPCSLADAALVCRSGVCESGVCQPPVACTVDGDCAVTEFCNPELHTCASKLPNGTIVPTLSGHTPPLTGSCNTQVASAVCSSAVCSTSDDTCGYPDGEGPCTQNDAAEVCRSGACSDAGMCGPAAACTEDTDCNSSQFCDTARGACVPKLDNGTPIPSITGHTPELTGACSAPAASAVCTSAVCDAADNACGYANGTGPCTKANATSVCRSGACSVSGVCQPLDSCTVDGDCAATQFCNTEKHACVSKLPNGDAIPTVTGHTPELTGACDDQVGAAVCASAVCDEIDDNCGFANGDGSCNRESAANVCRSTVCDPDGKCGNTDGNGPCTPENAKAICRSGTCNDDGVCGPNQPSSGNAGENAGGAAGEPGSRTPSSTSAQGLQGGGCACSLGKRESHPARCALLLLGACALMARRRRAAARALEH